MFTSKDRQVLRQLALRVHEIASLPVQEEKRSMWRRHTALQGGIPPVFVSPEGSWVELIPPETLVCEDAFAREAELELRRRIYRWEYIRDDTPIEDQYDLPVSCIPINENWGLPILRREAQGRGAWRHQPVIEEPGDWKKLKKPSLDVDVRGAEERARQLKDAAGDALRVNVTGIKIFDFHIAHIYCDYRGLDNLFIDLIDDEEMVKDVFAFLADGLNGLVEQARQMKLVQSNNDYTYHYTGGLGYCDDLPPAADQPAEIDQVWGAAEAQEYSCVSPEMFCRTVLPFERKLLEPFGLTGYGCCDDLTEKLDEVLKIPNLRRVAACPWANLGKMAQRLKKEYILTWKPNPAHLAAETFDEAALEKYMTESLLAAKPGYPEIILRDTHTCRNDPKRFGKFVEITRRAIEKVYER